MKALKRIANSQEADSYATRLRRRRFARFVSLLESLSRPIRILDIGGTQLFWETMQFTEQVGISVVLLDLERPVVTYPMLIGVTGDGRHMPQYGKGDFDVVFSNSVIEHVGSYEDQMRMAGEIRRVGRRYFVQTPNRYFPMEPHFLVPFFQFLPISLRVFLLTHFEPGWYGQGLRGDRQEAETVARSIRLLTGKELQEMFAGAIILRERFLGLTKSFVVCGGWEELECLL